MAADSQQATHRPTLKQQNKAHKHGRHRTKGQLNRDSQGRVNVKILSKKNKRDVSRIDRKNQAIQSRKQKREEALAKKRNRGSYGTPPHLVVVVPLHVDVDIDSVLDVLKSCDETLTVSTNEQGIIHISIPRFKQRLAIHVPQKGNLYALLDAAKVADSLLGVLSPYGGIDGLGDFCLKCLSSQGLPVVNFVTKGLKVLPIKKQNEAKKLLQKMLETRFPSEKVHTLDSEQDGVLILRQMTERKLRPVHYREIRPHLIAEQTEFEIENDESEHGVLRLSGYLRGRGLSVNGLIHLPGWGDFQMTQIDLSNDPYPLYGKNKKSRDNQEVDMQDEEIKLLEKSDPIKQESLQAEVIPDPMDGEQTWPTEEELAEAEAAAKKVKKVPKGTSDYQASWIVDSENEEEQDEGESDDDEDMEDGLLDDADSASDEERDNDEEFETLTMTEAGDPDKYDEQMDLDEDKQMLVKMKEEKMHVMFPDELDTPMDMSARIRFQRYRGLKSFRTSPWDPKENLPSDYARIVQFENFRRTKKRVMSEDDDSSALPGWYIRIHIANVPREFMESYQTGSPVIAFGLLQHEQKMSVVNFQIQRNTDVREPIKSKERLIFHVGCRRFSACPVFSQHTNASKHKFERYLPHDASVIATVYAPVTFPPCPILVFKESYSGDHKLIATGSVHSINPDRLVVKRVVLSGHLFKVNKKSAVVRYMFFNRDDIMWFKPVELRTKWGRRGHIKEPLGTHGHMKCIFDGQLKSQDTVLLNLFKRMYPKWTYNSHVRTPALMMNIDAMDAEEEESDGEDKEAYKLFE